MAVGLVGVIMLSRTSLDGDVVVAQARKPVVMTRLYTGADGEAQVEDVEVKLGGNPVNEISETLKVTGAEIHRYPPGYVNDWHRAPRRQLVITLSGRGELELGDGKKVPLEPGHVELAEDTRGRGHLTRVVGSEDRVTIQLALAP
jgi:hypothetical protein